MATTSQPANHFVLSGGATEVTYSTTSITGAPLFSYSGPDGQRSFTGDEIEADATRLGTEVTVTLDAVADLHTITLTVLLPSFRLPDDGASHFDTLAIKTTNHTTIAGPPEGAGQSYEAIELHGTAQFVMS